MRLVVWVFLGFFCVTILSANVAYAQAPDIGYSRLHPASPFYFLKAVRESLELKFAGTTRIRALRQMEFATRRIREVKSLVKTPRQDLIEPTLERYLSHLGEAKGIINLKDAGNVTQDVTWHMGVLQTVYGQVSDTRAKRSIRNIINRLSGWDGQLISKLKFLSQFSLAQKLAASKLSGCNFLSREASASALNEVERVVLADRAEKCLQGLQ